MSNVISFLLNRKPFYNYFVNMRFEQFHESFCDMAAVVRPFPDRILVSKINERSVHLRWSWPFYSAFSGRLVVVVGLVEWAWLYVSTPSVDIGLQHSLPLRSGFAIRDSSSEGTSTYWTKRKCYQMIWRRDFSGIGLWKTIYIFWKS